MSYILQALQRAEEDRRAEAAAMAVGPTRRPAAPAGKPFWPWLVGGGLVINALVIGAIFVVTRPSGPAVVASLPPAVEKVETPAVTDAPRAQVPPVPAPVVETKPSPTKVADVVARTPAANAPQPDTARAIAPPAAPARPTPPAPPVALAPAIAPEPPTIPGEPSPRRRRRGSLGEPTPTTGTPTSLGGLPSQPKIEVLVWATDPKERMVFLNGRKYVEGDKLENGAVIEQIAEDSVVLVQGGQRIRVRSEAR